MRSLAMPVSLAALVFASGCSADKISQRAPQLSLVRSGEIGATDGGDGELRAAQAVTVAPDGRVLVFDYTPHQLKEYDASGRFIRVIGRRGKGPGEFENVHHIGFLGDTMWTADVDHTRITLFPAGSADVVTYSMRYDPAREGLFPATPFGMLSGGLAVAQGEVFDLGISETQFLPSSVVLLRRDGTVADTVTTMQVPVGAGILVPYLPATPGGRRGAGQFPQIFLRRPFIAARPDGEGFVIVEGAAPEQGKSAVITVRTHNAAGVEVGTRDYPYTPFAANDHFIDSLVAARTTRSPPGTADEVKKKLVREPFLPTVSGLLVGRDGSVFIRREAHGSKDIRWTVINANGDLLGDVVLPGSLVVRYADLSQILVGDRNADDIPLLAKFTFVPPIAG